MTSLNFLVVYFDSISTSPFLSLFQKGMESPSWEESTCWKVLLRTPHCGVCAYNVSHHFVAHFLPIGLNTPLFADNSFSLPFSEGFQRVMENPSALRILDLQGSLQDSEAVCVLVSALESRFCRLTELNLSGNIISERTTQKLASILESRLSLAVLNLSG